MQSEMGASDYGPRPVRRSLLQRSSKPPYRHGTREEFGECEESGAVLLLDELQRCEASGRLVDRDLLITCAESGRRILKAESHKCAWLGKRVLKSLVRCCELTGLPISARHLDKNDMLAPLADMLDGYHVDEVVERSDLIRQLQRIEPQLFADVGSVYAVPSPGGDKMAVCATVFERGWFVTRKRYAGFLLTGGSDARIVGHLVLGARKGKQWRLLRTLVLE